MKGSILAVLLLALFAGDTDKGRKGNKRYAEKKYEEAAKLFKEGIDASGEEGPSKTKAGLFNNWGSALNRLRSFEEASAAFAASKLSATNEPELSRAAYNAGNTKFQAQDPQGSLAEYREAMIADPSNEAARYNYEFVKRMLDSQQQQGDSGEDQQQDQQQQQNQNDQEKQEDQQEGEQDQEQEQQQDQNEQEQQQDQQPQPEQPDRDMSPEQAEQILQALQNDEEELLRQVWKMKGKPRNVEKDW